jgi:fucose 4-O-acetylase-like acetyltransferase
MKWTNRDFVYSNQRMGWMDYDRGISIILVTYRHVFESLYRAGIDVQEYPMLEYINVFFFGFRMPLFFIASGIFIRNGIRRFQLSGYLGNRIKTILYPMLVWGIIQISLQLIFSSYTNSGDSVSWKTYLDLIIDPRKTGQFWYLNALFSVGVLYAILSVAFRFSTKHQLILGVVLYGISSYVHRYDVELGAINDVLKYYLFFSIGDGISDFMLKEDAKKFFTSKKIMLLLLIAFCINQYFFTRINLTQASNYYVENQMPLFFLLVALTGCALSLAVSFSLTQSGSLKFLRVVGYNSVHIYCMQIIFISISRLIALNLFEITDAFVLAFIMLGSAVLLPIMVYNICLRLNMWWWFTLKKPTAELNYLREKQ